MVKGRYSLLVLPLLVITSCGNKQRELRSDIKEFISGFSLTKSIENYKAASYSSTFESYVNGVKENEDEYVEFDCRDDANITYSHVLNTYRDDVHVSTKRETIATEEGKYIHTLDDNSEEYTKAQCISLITTYFYRSEPVEGFHDYGMYDGDYIIGVALTFQDYITIDQENKTLEFNILIDDPQSDAKIKHEAKVNETGMLLRVYNKTEKLSTKEYAVREITTSKIS